MAGGTGVAGRGVEGRAAGRGTGRGAALLGVPGRRRGVARGAVAEAADVAVVARGLVGARGLYRGAVADRGEAARPLRGAGHPALLPGAVGGAEPGLEVLRDLARCPRPAQGAADLHRQHLVRGEPRQGEPLDHVGALEHLVAAGQQGGGAAGGAEHLRRHRGRVGGRGAGQRLADGTSDTRHRGGSSLRDRVPYAVQQTARRMPLVRVAEHRAERLVQRGRGLEHLHHRVVGQRYRAVQQAAVRVGQVERRTVGVVGRPHGVRGGRRRGGLVGGQRTVRRHRQPQQARHPVRRRRRGRVVRAGRRGAVRDVRLGDRLVREPHQGLLPRSLVQVERQVGRYLEDLAALARPAADELLVVPEGQLHAVVVLRLVGAYVVAGAAEGPRTAARPARPNEPPTPAPGRR